MVEGVTPLRMRNRIRERREQQGWTQLALAQKLGVSRQTVNAVETGKYDPSLPLAFKLAHVFGSPIEELFVPEDER
jgi:putative transcriptional regulator